MIFNLGKLGKRGEAEIFTARYPILEEE